MNRRTRCISIAVAGLSLGMSVLPAAGENVQFNTDTGVMTIDGSPTTSFFGVPVQSSVVGGTMQFRFLGDLQFISSDVVGAVGSRPLSLWAGDDVIVDSGAVLNFDSVGQTSKLGGGNGGAAVSGGSAGTGGGGSPFTPIGGGGGAGGDVSGGTVPPGQTGSTGSSGPSGSSGTFGGMGQNGLQGTAGFNNAGGVRAAGSGGGVGNAGVFASTSTGGSGGPGGSGQPSGFGEGEDGDTGSTGGTGDKGGNGGSGNPGGNGLGGLNTVAGLMLSGGAGGSGGGGGGGGGGGAGGTSGAGGGGGGGGGGGFIFPFPESGATGGLGGFGGTGGDGGNGATGQGSGRGGAGGGAIEIIAQGRLNFAGSISARGASALARPTAGSPQNGSAGSAGTVGFSGGTTTLDIGGDGGTGGPGGTGGAGGNGGAAGSGGHGGGGAGGTIMFKSSLFSAAGATINTTGGPSDASVGGNGRYVTAENGRFQPNFGTIVGAAFESFLGQGGGDVNPFIEPGTGTQTYHIVDLVGGADVYGLKANVTTQDSYFDSVRDNAPAGAIAAMIRRQVGTTQGESYLGQDLLMLVNLIENPLANPMLGLGDAGESFMTPLLQRGFARNPAFGGAGPETLLDLPAGSVFTTLAPSELIDDGQINVSVSGVTFGVIQLDTSTTIYVLAPTLEGDYNQDGVVDAADYVVWRKNSGTQEAYNIWRAHFGDTAGGGSVESSAVPEPASFPLLLLAAVGVFLRRRGDVASHTTRWRVIHVCAVNDTQLLAFAR
jgi:hypothetical protein